METSYTPDWKTLHQYQLCTEKALLCGRLLAVRDGVAPTIEDTGVSIVKLLFDNLLQDDTSKHKRLGPQDDHLIEERTTSLVGGLGTGRPGREKPLSPPNPSNPMLR